MSDPAAFPRVLIVGTEAFNRTLGGGITMGNLFRGWPRERIAAAHREAVPTTDETCNTYYRLGPAELRRWGPFERAAPPAGVPAAAPVAPSPQRRALRAARAVVFGTQLPDVGRLSAPLERWIAGFGPQLLYSTLGTNGVMELVLAVQKRFRLPLVVHFMDDWPMSAYRGGLFGAFGRRRMQARLGETLQAARARLGICDAMSRAYEARYGVPFRSFQNTVDVARWSRERTEGAGAQELVYVGSVLPGGQLESLVDCCRAVAALGREGLPVRLAIHSPVQHTAPHRARLLAAPNVSLHDAITDDEAFFQRLTSAHALLLPVDFDARTVRFLRYSMPTKVPAYLCAGTPVLAYGPDEVAQMQYAREADWALVVSRRGVEHVKAGVRRILSDAALRARLSASARRTALERHDAARVRGEFREVLRAAAA